MNELNKPLSHARKKYLKRLKLTKIYIKLMQFLILFLFLLLWEIAVNHKIIDGFMFSSPSRVVNTLILLHKSGELYTHIFTTLAETIAGFLLATITGFIIAVIFWFFEKTRKIFEPYVVVLNALPKIALGPIIIIAFGAGVRAIIFMTFLVTVIVTIINMLNGFLHTDSGKVFLLKSMKATKLQILIHLVIPYSMPTLFSTLKVNVGLAWIGSIMGEYIVSRQGLGYLIVYGGQVLKLDLVMTSTLILCILAALMYLIILFLQKILIKHR
ncbi:MAG: ABC transporter permease [Clostridia bacterium]|nr:ABC transporter permease [Clostridia bacterium]